MVLYSDVHMKTVRRLLKQNDAFRRHLLVFFVLVYQPLNLPCSSVLIGSGIFCLHAEGRDCISVGPDEVNGHFGATLPIKWP